MCGAVSEAGQPTEAAMMAQATQRPQNCLVCPWVREQQREEWERRVCSVEVLVREERNRNKGIAERNEVARRTE